MFQTTHWSLVQQAQADSTVALETLFASYRSAMLAYLIRSQGFSDTDGEDLVQGFCEQFVRRGSLAIADGARGRFRTFLLTSLRNFVRDRQRASLAQRRGGGVELRSLDVEDPEVAPGPEPVADALAADVAYDRVWARSVLDRAWQRLSEECARRGLAPLCQALEPVLYRDANAQGYGALGASLGMSEGAIKVAVHRLKGRLRTLIREEVLQTVSSPGDLEDELRYLLRVFESH